MKSDEKELGRGRLIKIHRLEPPDCPRGKTQPHCISAFGASQFSEVFILNE